MLLEYLKNSSINFRSFTTSQILNLIFATEARNILKAGIAARLTALGFEDVYKRQDHAPCITSQAEKSCLPTAD